MKIGIDISQIAYEHTGVANYLRHFVAELTRQDTQNEYILFFSSLRKKVPESFLKEVESRVVMRYFRLPPSVLDLLWNRLHIAPIEQFLGDIDIFISSDWSQPPSKKAKLVTVLYDLIIYKYPEETHNMVSVDLKNLKIQQNIVAVQKRRLKWVQKECDAVLCISEATRNDAIEILGIDENKLYVTYPGVR